MEIQPQELKARLDRGENVWLLDVRLPWEHELARLPDHALIPVQELRARLDEVTPPPDALVVAYCHHGVRSLRAAMMLREAGFHDALSLAGGIERWSQVIDPSVPRY